MDKTALALLERGDIPALLARSRSVYGGMVMTAPDQPAGDTVVVPAAPPVPPTPVVTTLTEEEVTRRIEAARQQEKDKLYPELNTLREQQTQTAQQLAELTAEREAREQREAEAVKAAEQAAEEKRQAELSFSEKLAEYQQQTLAQVGTLQEQLAARDALLEKERQFQALADYRHAALQNESNPEGPGRGLGPQVMPHLRDFVQGNTPEEIDQSISALAERSTLILQEVAQATGQARQQARGVGVTAPPVGPLDTNSGYESYTADDIRNMSPSEFAANRGRLLGAASSQHKDRGMFG